MLRAARVTADQLATDYIHLGTTGRAEGVMLTHNNLSSNEENFRRVFWHDSSGHSRELSLRSRMSTNASLPTPICFGGVPDGIRRAHGRLPAGIGGSTSTLAAAVPRVFEKT